MARLKRRNGVYKKCIQCGVEFFSRKDAAERGGGKLCSKQCLSAFRRRGRFCNCSFCGKRFYRQTALIKLRKNLFCSPACYQRSRPKKVAKCCINCGATFKSLPCNRRMYCSVKCRTDYYIGRARKDRPRANRGRITSYIYGGTKTYSAIHQWIRRNHGPAARCSYTACAGKSTTYQWANISGRYKRDRTDFMELCVRCHIAFDKGRILRQLRR